MLHHLKAVKDAKGSLVCYPDDDNELDEEVEEEEEDDDDDDDADAPAGSLYHGQPPFWTWTYRDVD